MALIPSNSSNLEQLALKGLSQTTIAVVLLYLLVVSVQIGDGRYVYYRRGIGDVGQSGERGPSRD